MEKVLKFLNDVVIFFSHCLKRLITGTFFIVGKILYSSDDRNTEVFYFKDTTATFSLLYT